MIGKIINGQLYYPTEEEQQKIIVSNPTEDILKYIMGFKEIVTNDIPEYDSTTQILVENYTEDGDKIVISYTVETLPKVEERIYEEPQDEENNENEVEETIE